jgi:hypothetical protein
LPISYIPTISTIGLPHIIQSTKSQKEQTQEEVQSQFFSSSELISNASNVTSLPLFVPTISSYSNILSSSYSQSIN